MTEVTLKLTQEELEVLIERVFIGEYILESDEEETDERGYLLLQKILQAAEANKAVKGITRNELDNLYLIPYAMEEALVGKIDEYNEDIFVDSLIDELAENEMKLKYAPRLMANMNEETYERLSADIVEALVKEFEANGYSNLCIKGAKE